MMIGSNPLVHAGIVVADESAIANAAHILRAGGMVAVPTETVYGLAADASNADGVAAIYRAKGRPDFNPLIVHVPDMETAQQLAQFDDRSAALAAAFWPGPLTLVLPVLINANITKAVTAGLATVAIRCPAHPVMQALLRESGLCLAAPSANLSGAISPTRARHVAVSLGKSAPMILDGGACEAGLESTIVALRPRDWQILREGPITRAQLSKVLHGTPVPLTSGKIEAPGQLTSHYAPSKPLRLNANTRCPNEYWIGFGAIEGDQNLSPVGDLAEAAAHLFDALHRADASAAQAIAVVPIPATGVGAAINDRLNRAAAR